MVLLKGTDARMVFEGLLKREAKQQNLVAYSSDRFLIALNDR